MSLSIRGLGTAVPGHCIGQKEAAEAASKIGALSDRERKLVRVLYRQAGVQKRHSVVLDGGADGGSADQSFYPQAEDSNSRGPTTPDRMAVYTESAAPLAATACR